VRAAPYARDFAAHWPAKAGLLSRADVRAYMAGLAAFAHSRNAGLRAAERVAWLNRAHQCFAEALDTAATLPRRMSFARTAWELGLRARAIVALEPARERIAQDAASAFKEPFLAPSPRYEQLPAGNRAADWLRCAVTETYDKLRHRSSIFAGTESLDTLEPIRDLPFRSAEVERRRQLERICRGLQPGPEPVAMLCERSEENLNPQFWSGAERVALSRPGRR
ncbi:MAG TPA: hypothetical protein VMU46_00830, partial [Burkholderiales bacterium]|nr:hypothetical protein [Burkholderiales bacterium]